MHANSVLISVCLLFLAVCQAEKKPPKKIKCVEEENGRIVDATGLGTNWRQVKTAKGHCEADQWCAKVTAKTGDIVRQNPITREVDRTTVANYAKRFCVGSNDRMPFGKNFCDQVKNGCKKVHDYEDPYTKLEARGEKGTFNICCCNTDNCNAGNGVVPTAVFIVTVLAVLLIN